MSRAKKSKFKGLEVPYSKQMELNHSELKCLE